MDSLTAAHIKELGLQKAEFSRIDHSDTMIAEVYRVIQHSKPPLILKVCPRKSDYHRELHFLNHLAQLLPVPRVIGSVEPDSSNAGAILMECLEGRLLEPQDWNENLAYEIGSVLGLIHSNQTEGFGDLTEPLNISSKVSTYFENKFTEELVECASHLSKKVIEQCQNYFDSHRYLLNSVDGPCIIHRDFRPGNMIVSEGKLQGIIDWAGGRSGFAEQDFCPMEQGQWPNQTTHKKALLAGYSSIRSVPEYGRVMPLLQLGRALAIIGFTVKSDTWRNKNAVIYKTNRRFLDNFRFSY